MRRCVTWLRCVWATVGGGVWAMVCRQRCHLAAVCRQRCAGDGVSLGCGACMRRCAGGLRESLRRATARSPTPPPPTQSSPTRAGPPGSPPSSRTGAASSRRAYSPKMVSIGEPSFSPSESAIFLVSVPVHPPAGRGLLPRGGRAFSAGAGSRGARPRGLRRRPRDAP